MSLTNEILQFCPNDTGTNLETQAAYAADSNRTNGNQPGVASSQLNNKALRQATYVASQVAEFLKTVNNQSVLDNDTPAQLLQQLLCALQHLPPQITTVTATGAGTYNLPYAFFCAAANATAAATYSDGTTTFTVVATISGATLLYATGAAAPVTGGAAGTLTKTSGTGDATITYYAVRAPIQLEVEMVGGGGGASNDAGTNAGANGADTTFDSSTAGKGIGGFVSDNGGTGGTATLGSGWTGIAVAGMYGNSGSGAGVTNQAGVSGGNSYYGGAGTGLNGSAAGLNAAANSGSGGGAPTQGSNVGGGGGAGAFIRKWKASPASTYSYTVGTGGAGGAAGGVHAGGNGAAGRLTVIAKYQ